MIEGIVMLFALVVARVAFFVMVLPMLGGSQAPDLVKLGTTVALSGFWVSMLVGRIGDVAFLQQASNATWFLWALALGREALLGGILGFVFSLFTLPARIAGEFIGEEIGLSFGSVLTASSSGSAGPIAVILETLASLLFLGLDVHHLFLGVLNTTFTNFPVGVGFNIPICDAAGAAMSAEEWGIMLVLPVAICLFMTTIVLAVMTRAAPQLNLYTVGFPLRMIVGLGATILFLPQLLSGMGRMIAHFSDVLTRMM